MIKFNCPLCRRKIERPDDALFVEQVICPSCNHEFKPENVFTAKPSPATAPKKQKPNLFGCLLKGIRDQRSNAQGGVLSDCPICGTKISSTAHNCPGCGHPIKPSQRVGDVAGQLVAAIILIIIALSLWARF